MNKQQEPRLRFQGFTEIWEKSAIKDVVNVFDNLRIPVAVSERVSGNTPYFGANGIQDYVDGFTHDGEFVLIAEDGANDLQNYPIQYFNGKGWVNNHAHVLQGKAEILNNLFLFSRFQSMDISRFLVGGGRAKLNSGTMIEIEIEFPKNKKEQTTIGNFFRRLDSQIAESRAALEKSRQLKKAMLAKMFPTSGEKMPKIRFKGFEGEWETYQICDLFRITRGNVLATTNLVDNKNEDYCYPVYSSQTKNKGLMGYWKHYLFENAITWTTDGANAGDVNFRSGKFYCTNVCGVLINEEGFANQCIAEILNLVTPSYVSYVGNPKLMNNVMAEIPILIPPTIKEQTAIGNFFRQLDETIALQSAEVEKLNQLKKGLLTAMLV